MWVKRLLAPPIERLGMERLPSHSTKFAAARIAVASEHTAHVRTTTQRRQPEIDLDKRRRCERFGLTHHSSVMVGDQRRRR